MKGFLKVVVWIIVLAAVCVGVYFVLPEYPQNYVKSVVQPLVDANAKVRIQEVQNILNKDFDNVSYKTLLEGKVKNPCWAYQLDETTGVEHVTFYGRGIELNLKEWEEYGGKLSTSATVKIDFVITNKSKVEIVPYVDGVMMQIKDGKHVEKNDKILKAILSQMYTGMGPLENQ